ncbi:MAG: anthranilate synthase component I [Cyanosarcina radialis HA8281-LM2]|jgi:para-aminobenzoate synthetase component 1|nr:anthranilate synthase component I [Cyanosarcina radialis HA8281-LM2]
MKELLPWFWRSLPLEDRTGSDVFEALFYQPNAIGTLLESPPASGDERNELTRYSICAGSPRLVAGKPQTWTPPVGQILPFLHHLLQHSAIPRAEEPQLTLPFTGGWLGWLGYDLAWEIERLPTLKSDPLPFPVAFWYEPASFAILDRWEQTLWLASTAQSELDRLEYQLERSPFVSPSPHLPISPSRPPLSIDFLSSQADYEDAVRQAKKYIQAGDIFQANISLRFATRTTADSWTIYRALQQINPSPMSSYWQTPWGAVISCSPERLVRSRLGSDSKFEISTRPIAGTRARGTNIESDRQLGEDLLSNAKERAEHIMLVDLERNDLGRVCEWGSVAADELFAIERYSHVMHLVSNVRGILQPDLDPIDAIRALFPGGTITGCPKVRCLEIIEELEPVRRNLFYGSCGYLDWRGNLDLNILIRTLLFGDREQRRQYSPLLRGEGQGVRLTRPTPHSELSHIVWGQVGAGIVADSDPEQEWFESLHKAQAQLAALGLVA